MTKIITHQNPSKPAKNFLTEEELKQYFSKISKYKLLTGKEEQELGKRIEKGDHKAKTELIQSNLRLVITIASKYNSKKLSYLDLIQEGNAGLIKATEKYNYKYGYRFSTYATYWIKQNINKAISEQSHSFKIPVYIQETISKYSKTKNTLEKKHCKQLNVEFVAKEMKCSPTKIKNYLQAFEEAVSLDAPINSSYNNNLVYTDILKSKDDIVINYENAELRRDINRTLSSLKERERTTLKMRYGLNNSKKRTLEGIGEIYGVTKECIRQTEIRAIKKVRNICYNTETLTNYLY